MFKKRFFQFYIVFIFILVISHNALGEIYRYADKNGIYHFTNRATDERYKLYLRPPTPKEIFAAQKLLNNLGYYPGKIDGIWGDQTKQAINKYQSRFGLGGDGHLTEETKSHMKIPVAKSPPPKNAKLEQKIELPQIELPPVVFFQTPSAKKITVHEPFIRIKAGAKALGEDKIEDIQVFLNGKSVERLSDIKRGKKGLEAFIEITVPLEQEMNMISIVASNRHKKSKPEMIGVRWEKEEPDFARTKPIYRPNLYLLSIGVSKHRDSTYNLDFAHEDAKSIGLIFQNQEGKLYQKVNKQLVLKS